MRRDWKLLDTFGSFQPDRTAFFSHVFQFHSLNEFLKEIECGVCQNQARKPCMRVRYKRWTNSKGSDLSPSRSFKRLSLKPFGPRCWCYFHSIVLKQSYGPMRCPIHLSRLFSWQKREACMPLADEQGAAILHPYPSDLEVSGPSQGVLHILCLTVYREKDIKGKLKLCKYTKLSNVVNVFLVVLLLLLLLLRLLLNFATTITRLRLIVQEMGRHGTHIESSMSTVPNFERSQSSLLQPLELTASVRSPKCPCFEAVLRRFAQLQLQTSWLRLRHSAWAWIQHENKCLVDPCRILYIGRHFCNDMKDLGEGRLVLGLERSFEQLPCCCDRLVPPPPTVLVDAPPMEADQLCRFFLDLTTW